jgi:hypothetical protein
METWVLVLYNQFILKIGNQHKQLFIIEGHVVVTIFQFGIINGQFNLSLRVQNGTCVMAMMNQTT